MYKLKLQLPPLPKSYFRKILFVRRSKEINPIPSFQVTKDLEGTLYNILLDFGRSFGKD
jgi:hypothetical protein